MMAAVTESMKGCGRGSRSASTHKVGLSSTDDVTPEVEALLQAAYEQNG
jgi:hypothetical protein